MVQLTIDAHGGFERWRRFEHVSALRNTTALQEHVFEVAAIIGSIEPTKNQLEEWMKPVEALNPKVLAATESAQHPRSGR